MWDIFYLSELWHAAALAAVIIIALPLYFMPEPNHVGLSFIRLLVYLMLFAVLPYFALLFCLYGLVYLLFSEWVLYLLKWDVTRVLVFCVVVAGSKITGALVTVVLFFIVMRKSNKSESPSGILQGGTESAKHTV